MQSSKCQRGTLFAPLGDNMMKRLSFVLLAIMAFAFPTALAQDFTMADAEAHMDALSEAAEKIDGANEKQLLDLREEIRSIRQEADNFTEPLRSRSEELAGDLDRLAPKPKDEEEVGIELPEITARREALQGEFDKLDSVITQTELNIIEANRLLSDIAILRSQQFYDRIFVRDPPPFKMETLRMAFEYLFSERETLSDKYTHWSSRFETEEEQRVAVFWIVASIISILLLLALIPLWAEDQFFSDFLEREPTYARRTFLAAFRVLFRVFLAMLASLALYILLGGYDAFEDEASSRLLIGALFSFSTIFIAADSVRAVLTSKRLKWRLIPLIGNKAFLLRFSIVSAIILFSLNNLLTGITEWVNAPREIMTVLSASINSVGAIFVFMTARGALWKTEPEFRAGLTPEVRNFWFWVRLLISLTAVFCLIAILLGYIALGRYVLMRLFFFALFFIAAWLAHELLAEYTEYIGQKIKRADTGKSHIGEASEKEEDQQGLIIYWLKLLIDISIIIGSVPIIMLIIGIAWADIRTWVFDAFFGITIGGFTISLANILGAFLAALIVMTITRFIQRTADSRIFEPARVDMGLRNTFKTLIGYVGLVMGFMIAIGVLGFPLANLALVAGALSFGFAFGMQSVVNNFVSGLILLFERPIKVGDWIVTTSGEGIVKRISVRSTEIETFDWASVIIPNSELISAAVMNWTHKNRYTRITINVGVSYGSDIEKVTEILMREAKLNKRTLSFPAPLIYFANYGDSSLDFEVRIFINNVDNRIPVQNELRYSIFHALKEANIEIPFPQRDLHLRSVEDGILQPGQIMSGKPILTPGQPVTPGQAYQPDPRSAKENDKNKPDMESRAGEEEET